MQNVPETVQSGLLGLCFSGTISSHGSPYICSGRQKVWLLTELIFQNIPRYGCSLGSPRPFDHSDDTQKTTEEKEPARKNQEDLP